MFGRRYVNADVIKGNASMHRPYNVNFYKWLRSSSKSSAEEIVPMVMEFVHPKSVIDIGCGPGTWLEVFMKHGVEDILGVDGMYVDDKDIVIPREKFLRHDVGSPINIERGFDLVVCLEVAEHIAPVHAADFVNSLVRLGSVVLFSAAVPFQGGVNHVNEQWPDYWIELFRKKGYKVVDCIRKKIWNNDKVEYWYAQNILLFIGKENLGSFPHLKGEHDQTGGAAPSLIHPNFYLKKVEMAGEWVSLLKTIKSLPKRLANFLKRVIK